MDFIVANLPIFICAVAGLALVVLEVFLPGFGLPGISGIALLLVAVGMTIYAYGVLAGLGLLIVTVAILAIVVSLSLKSAASGKLAKSKFFLQDTVVSEEPANEDMQVFLGHEGVALSVLRPAGIADFDGVRLNVVTQGDFIEKGEQVVITQVQGSRIVVRKG